MCCSKVRERMTGRRLTDNGLLTLYLMTIITQRFSGMPVTNLITIISNTITRAHACLIRIMVIYIFNFT